jgi:hypothetical protein
MYRFEGHRAPIQWGCLSPDGRLLLSTSDDAPCFIWDIFGTQKEPKGAIDPEQSWRDLADKDAKKAFLAIRELAARPGLAVDLIRKNLKPNALSEAPQVDKLIGELDSPTFAVREAAMADLIKVVECIEPELNKARATAPLEVRTRIDSILEKAGQPTPERLRESRCVGILEVVATPAAAQLLSEFAAGSRFTTLAIEASAARERLRGLGGKQTP